MAGDGSEENAGDQAKTGATAAVDRNQGPA
jgi:hypothetical protein